MIGIDFGISGVSIYEQDDPCCQKLFLYMESVVSTTVMFALIDYKERETSKSKLEIKHK
jgi:hypothetical protein